MGFGSVALQGKQIVLALGLQQVEEAVLVTRQAIAFQPVQPREEIVGAGQAHGEVAAVFRPLLAVPAEAFEQLRTEPAVAALAFGQLLGQATFDHAEMRFQIV